MKTFTKELDQFGIVMICGGHVTKEYKMKTTNIINWCRICRVKSDCRVHPKLRIDMNVTKRLDLSLSMDGKLFNIAAKGEMANMCYKHADYKLFVYDGSEQNVLKCLTCGVVDAQNPMFLLASPSFLQVIQRKGNSERLYKPLQNNYCCLRHLPQCILKDDYGIFCTLCARRPNESSVHVITRYSDASLVEKLLKGIDPRWLDLLAAEGICWSASCQKKNYGMLQLDVDGK